MKEVEELFPGAKCDKGKYRTCDYISYPFRIKTQSRKYFVQIGMLDEVTSLPGEIPVLITHSQLKNQTRVVLNFEDFKRLINDPV